MKIFLSIFSFLFLSACATDGVRTTTGQNLGEAMWQAIEIEDSKLSAPKAITDHINYVSLRSFPNRRQERFIFKNGGSVLFEWTYSGGFLPPNASRFKALFKGTTLAGKAISADEINLQHKSDMPYSLISRGDRQCILFYKPVGSFTPLTGGYGNTAYIRGSFCKNKEENFVGNMEKLIDRVKFER